MEENNNERGKNVLIVCLVVIILVLGVLLFLAVSGRIGSKSTSSSQSGNEVTTNTAKDVKADFEDIENKYLGILYPYTDLSGVSNQAFMRAVILNASFYPTESFTKEQLEEALKSSVFSMFTIKHEDFWTDPNSKALGEIPNYSYNADTGVYTANPVGHGACRSTPVYKKVIDYQENNGEYTIKYKYVWYYGCEGSQPDTWYGSYNDADSQKNAIYSIDTSKYDHNTIPSDVVEDEVKTNWQSIESKLDTYTYTFKIEDNHYVLSNFRRTEP